MPRAKTYSARELADKIKKEKKPPKFSMHEIAVNDIAVADKHCVQCGEELSYLYKDEKGLCTSCNLYMDNLVLKIKLSTHDDTIDVKQAVLDYYNTIDTKTKDR